MKKLFKFSLIILVLLAILSSSIMAQNSRPDYPIPDNWTYLKSEQPELWYWEDETVINASDNQIQPLSTTKLNVNRLRQRDSRWANDTLGNCDSKIGGMGCALVSLTMAYNFVTGKNVTPDYINDRYPSKTCSFAYGGMNWSIQKDLGIKIGNSTAVTNSSAYNAIKPHLQKNRPVIVYLEKSSGGTHFMVAYGFNTSNQTIYVRDPDDTNFQSLAAAKAEGWNIKTYRYVE